jgi:hypothetical protein
LLGRVSADSVYVKGTYSSESENIHCRNIASYISVAFTCNPICYVIEGESIRWIVVTEKEWHSTVGVGIDANGNAGITSVTVWKGPAALFGVAVDHSGWIDSIRGIIANVGIAVPRLRVGRVDRCEAGRVGMHPAAEAGGVLTEPSVVEACFGVSLVAGEFVSVDAGIAGIEFAKRKVIEVLHYGLIEVRKQASGPEMIGVSKVCS